MPRPLLCREGELACSHSGKCLPEAWRCDGAADCGDGSDEQVSGAVGTQPVPTHAQEAEEPFSPSALQGCPREEGPCGDQQWGCSRDRECIPDVWRCDGETDCTDGSDEASCKQHPDFIPSVSPRGGWWVPSTEGDGFVSVLR